MQSQGFSLLGNQDNLGNQKNGEERRRLAEEMGVAA
uniref:Uncharacterized protein MANES_12G002700 n=1 Tax=Rhizophora mucronata TaxID=61149 RepID=A0A2P2JM51_RHIMU